MLRTVSVMRMGMSCAARSSALRAAAGQGGAVSRRQLVALGVTDAQIRAQLLARRWRVALPGVYLTFTGPAPPLTRVWAAVLYAGPGAAASHDTALWLWGLSDAPPDSIDVTVPAGRRVRPQRRLRIHTCEHLDVSRHPSALPPRTRVEPTVLSLAATAHDPEVVVALLAGAVQRRRTSAARLATEARSYSRLRHRALVREVLADISDGALSNLERRYLRDVERAHGLPRGERNRLRVVAGRRRYDDVRYRRYRVVVELDGRQTHPAESSHLDRRRDNSSAAAGDAVYRYGWSDAGRPCEAAIELATIFRRNGWTGELRPCGPDCLVRRAA